MASKNTPKRTIETHPLMLWLGQSRAQSRAYLQELLEQLTHQEPPSEVFLTRQELKKRWQLSLQAIDLMIKAGDIKVLRIGRLIRIPLDEIERFERENTR